MSNILFDEVTNNSIEPETSVKVIGASALLGRNSHEISEETIEKTSAKDIMQVSFNEECAPRIDVGIVEMLLGYIWKGEYQNVLKTFLTLVPEYKT